ncbi:heavy-metal-associated domain-containing protein [Candidatus Viridilinea mediisalina]|uniref:Copper-binding protein n=1 Tax=Candidatus Viridilinea mediisalina TaxID=2024553 RepID=A0A2A6RN77_9CHLR|nr:heavy-metal-associated domain-containing protein [Candidatus Viridilinea mediisalina]PDW04376.1 copper-binding protein [Candidatus Viridilinea mediisalina]
MQTKQYTVPAISCQHCVRAVTEEVQKLAGVQAVRVDLPTKVVTVEHSDACSSAAIVAAINEAGYDEVVQH